MLLDLKWGTNNVTFSFPASKIDYTGYTAGSYPDSNFIGLTTKQQDADRTALASWSNVCNLNFTETTGGNGVIRFGTSSIPYTSETYWPSTDERGGDVWFGNNNQYSPSNPVIGSYHYDTYIHEIGHALGLKHPHETNGSGIIAMHDIDSIEFSVMSYRSYVDGSTGYITPDGSFPTVLLLPHDARK